MIDNLQELCDYIQQHTEATGVFIGQLVKPLKPISEDSKDKDHIDETALEEIQILHASPLDQKFLEGKKWVMNQEGVTYEVFKNKEEEKLQTEEELSQPIETV